MIEISEETNNEFFTNKNNVDPTHKDLGTITIRDDRKQELLVKYLEELTKGNNLYKPPELNFE